MEVSEHDIEGPMSLSNLLFVEKEQRSRLHPNNLEESEVMPDITSVQETFVTFLPQVEIQASNKSVHRYGNSFNSPTVTNARDDNTHIITGNDNIYPVVSQTQDDTGTLPAKKDSDNEDSPISSGSKSSE